MHDCENISVIDVAPRFTGDKVHSQLVVSHVWNHSLGSALWMPIWPTNMSLSRLFQTPMMLIALLCIHWQTGSPADL